jgi:hypothetical protein
MKYAGLILSLALVACGKSATTSDATSSQVKPLTAVCEVNAKTPTPWMCGESLAFECGDNPEEIAVPKTSGCELPYSVSPSAPYPVGTYDVVLSKGNRTVCASTVTVTDTLPPVITDKASELWPPNHKSKSYTVTDCAAVVDACNSRVKTFFRWVASNEAVNDKGDGNTSGDISLTCDAVSVVAERAGPGVGRVYRAGITAIDEQGNRVDGECSILVPHDQGKKSSAPAFVEAYRVNAPTNCENN